MKLNFDYKGTKITYNLTYKKANAISINVDASGKVNVIAPIGTSVYAVMDKVKGNAPWIISELNKGQAKVDEVKLLEQYMYLGKNYGLEVVKVDSNNPIKVKMMRGKFVVETATDDARKIRTAIIEWYKEKVTAKLKERLKAYKEHFNELPSRIEVQLDDNVLFSVNRDAVFANAKVGSVPADVIDYMLLSGLCRINSLDENATMEELLPQLEKSKQWLEENKNILSL